MKNKLYILGFFLLFVLNIQAMETQIANYDQFKKALEVYASDPENGELYYYLVEAYSNLTPPEKNQADHLLAARNIVVPGTSDLTLPPADNQEEPNVIENETDGEPEQEFEEVEIEIYGTEEFINFFEALHNWEEDKTENNFTTVLRSWNLVDDETEKETANNLMQAAIREDLDNQTPAGQTVDRLYAQELGTRIQKTNDEIEELQTLSFSFQAQKESIAAQNAQSNINLERLREENVQLRTQENELIQELDRRQAHSTLVQHNTVETPEALQTLNKELNTQRIQLETEIEALQAQIKAQAKTSKRK